MVKTAEVAEVIPGLVATRVYPPGWLIVRSENEAMPPLASTVTVPDSVPGPEFGPMATLTLALEVVASWPHPFRTSTLTGPPVESTWDVITAPAAVPVGWPSLVNASDKNPVDEEQADVIRPPARRALLPRACLRRAPRKRLERR